MKRKKIVCLLQFKSGIRSGGLAGDLNRTESGIHSSTVWGGLGCAAARLFPGKEVDRLVTEGKVSSLLWEKDGVYFIPRPLSLFKAEDPEKRKAAREWAWIPANSAASFIFEGELPPGPVPELFREERQRSAAVDRRTGSAVPYFRKRTVPLEGVRGVLAADMPEYLAPQFFAAVSLLGDMGLGGERSYGNGHFTVEFIDGENTPFGNYVSSYSCPSLALGAFLPTEEESLKISDSAQKGDLPLGYEIARCRGFAGESSDISKPTVTCLAAGSVFPFMPCGRTIDITPQFSSHPVLFNGNPPFLPLERP